MKINRARARKAHLRFFDIAENQHVRYTYIDLQFVHKIIKNDYLQIPLFTKMCSKTPYIVSTAVLIVRKNMTYHIAELIMIL